jgi:hypothetical protein
LFDLPYFSQDGHSNNPLEKTFWGRINIEKAYAYLLFKKTGIVKNMIQEIKYNGNKNLAFEFGFRFGQKVSKELQIVGINGIIAVPLHAKRLKKRGYDLWADWISPCSSNKEIYSSITGNNSLALGGTFSWSFTNSPTSYSVFCTGPTGTVFTTSNAYTYTGTTFRPGYDGTGWQGAGDYTIYVSARNAGGDSSLAFVTTYMN